MEGLYYNTWEHNGVRISDDYSTKKMTLFFRNGNQQVLPMQFKGEKVVDSDALEVRVDFELDKIHLKLYLPIAILLVIILCFCFLTNIWVIISSIIVTGICIIYHQNWYYKKIVLNLEEHYKKTIEVRDREKELRAIDFLILQYN